jgi:signal transduction histidine kinase
MKWAARSLLWRITLLHLVAVLALSIALPLVVRLVLDSTASSFQREALKRHEREVAGGLHREPNGGWRLGLRPELKTFYERAYGGLAYAVLDDHGRVLFSSLPNGGALFPAIADGETARFTQRRQGAAVYDGGSFPEFIDGQRLWVQIAQDLDNADVVVDDIVASFLKRIAWFTLPILALLMLADFVIVRRALAPVREASDMASKFGPSNLSLRLPTERLPNEIAPLSDAVNQALDRFEQGFRMQREFTADAAHELRTPLSIHRLRLSGLPDGKLKQALQSDIDRMARIVSQLLQVAQLETFVLAPDQAAELPALASEIVEYLAPMAVAQGRTLSLTGEIGPVWVRGDRQLIFQALRNLVENALAHTPEGTGVDVEVRREGVIKVMDRGPGIPAADRELVFRRFWRRDRTRSGGAGLGLSIVWRIVQAHGARIWIEDRPGGGAAFNIKFKSVKTPPAARSEEELPAERPALQVPADASED